MADPKEPKKETVRITLPPRPAPPPSRRRHSRTRHGANKFAGSSAGRADASSTHSAGRRNSRATSTDCESAIASRAIQTSFRAFIHSTAASTSFRTDCRFHRLLPRWEQPRPRQCPPSTQFRVISTVSRAEKRNRSHYPPARSAGQTRRHGADEKTQPLITMPDPNIESAPITVAPTQASEVVDLVPMSLCWTMLGGSALILIIQIWNYVA